MTGILLWIFLGCLIGAGVATIASFSYFDRILKIEVSLHSEQWVRDQRPIGFFHVPQGADWLSGSTARSTLFVSWSGRRPDWIDDGADVFCDYRRFKCARRIANVLMGAMLIIFITMVIWELRK